MGRVQRQTKAQELEAALARAAKLLGVKVDTSTIDLESIDDKMREAASVLKYFEAGGSGFYTETCKTCHGVFNYAWNVRAIKYCSPYCMNKALEAIGLSWDPNKLPEERYGRYIPAVIPPAASALVQEKFETPEDLLSYIDSV
jgi:hypothetical protein